MTSLLSLLTCHSHVPAKGDGPSDVRARMGVNLTFGMIILVLECPRNSLLKIKNGMILVE
jgi:hypothetical protein